MVVMKNNSLVQFLVALLCLCASCQEQKYSYEHSINYNPEKYVCHTTTDEIIIDGKDSESAWQAASWTNAFVDIEGSLKPNPKLDTKVKMLWDKSFFYFFAKMEEPHLWATLKNRDDIIYNDDDFEIFIDPDGDSHNYYELEWNAYNTLWDLILLRPYRTDNKPKVLFEWNITEVESAVHLEGTINDNTDIDKYWTLEVKIPWFALMELAPGKRRPKDGDQWRVNFSRVDWTMENDGSGYKKKTDDNGKILPENNWVWSPTGKINMHMPECWGYVQFSTASPNQKTAITQNPDEEIKWALWNLYWQQLAYYKEHKVYTDNLSEFTIPLVDACSFQPSIYISPYSFEISNSSCSSNGAWVINKEGKISLENASYKK